MGCDMFRTCKIVRVMLKCDDMSSHIFILMKWSDWELLVKTAFLPLSVLLSLLSFCEPRARSFQSLSWERLKDWNYIALMVDYFELPKRVAEGRRQVLVTRPYLEQENPSCPSSLQLFTAQTLCDLKEERSGRMLCATMSGECVPALPDSAQVCFECVYLSRLKVTQTGVITIKSVMIFVRNNI